MMTAMSGPLCRLGFARLAVNCDESPVRLRLMAGTVLILRN
jgi:hypothetical protein